MNLLYISSLSSNISAGQNWSTPASVKAQSKIDDVLWINTTQRIMPHWKEVSAYHNITDFSEKFDLTALPSPFNHPELVVFEGFYYIEHVKIARTLRKNRIPYIIVPRGSLTPVSLNNHAKWKKKIAHLLVFNRFLKKAAAIQYLTEQEYSASTDKWNKKHIIVPNGFDLPVYYKTIFSSNSISAVFIGRMDKWHKGLDLLIDACTHVQDVLRSSHFHLCLYGPKRYDYFQIEEDLKKNHIEDIVSVHNEIGGEEKKDVLMKSDIFIMTSRTEGHPMGLIEALAYGLPCLVSEGTNMREEVEKSNAGWTCEGSVREIENLLISITKERDLFSEKGKNARKLAEKYQWDKLAVEFHDKVQTIL